MTPSRPTVPPAGALLPWPATSAPRLPSAHPSVRAAPAPPSSPHSLLCLKSPLWGHAPRTLPLLSFPVALSLELGATSLRDPGRGWDDSASSPGKQVVVRASLQAWVWSEMRALPSSQGGQGQCWSLWVWGAGPLNTSAPAPVLPSSHSSGRHAWRSCPAIGATGPRATVQDALALALGAKLPPAPVSRPPLLESILHMDRGVGF